MGAPAQWGKLLQVTAAIAFKIRENESHLQKIQHRYAVCYAPHLAYDWSLTGPPDTATDCNSIRTSYVKAIGNGI